MPAVLEPAAPVGDTQEGSERSEPSEPSSSTIMRLAAVTTVRDPGASFDSFSHYHLSNGLERIFLFVEGRAGQSFLPNCSGVDVTIADEALEAEWRTCSQYEFLRPHLATEVMARQILNAELALRWSRDLGIDWLLHVDSDELLYVPGQSLQQFFEAVDRTDAEEVVFFNHEAVPESLEVTDCFREVTLFKTNRRHLAHSSALSAPFVAYTSGKAAARITAAASPHGVHRFRTRYRRRITTSGAVILHYPSCGYSRYVEKYRQLGHFSDDWFGQVSIPHTMRFHADSRDAVMSENWEETLALYRRYVMLDPPNVRDTLLKAGALQRILEPSRTLAIG